MRRPRLFDHLIGPGEDRLWDREAERLAGLEIDDQLKHGQLLNRQIGRLGAFEDLVDVGCRAPVQIREIRKVGYETTVAHERSTHAYDGQAVLQP